MHGGVRVYARTCCNNDTSLCRDASEQDRGILVLFNGLCSMICILLIPVVFRERRRYHEARGWALMEIFLLGAAILYFTDRIMVFSLHSSRGQFCSADLCCFVLVESTTLIDEMLLSVFLSIIDWIYALSFDCCQPVLPSDADLYQEYFVSLLIVYQDVRSIRSYSNCSSYSRVDSDCNVVVSDDFPNGVTQSFLLQNCRFFHRYGLTFYNTLLASPSILAKISARTLS
ncbi:unnamed protein product [Thelazia callipaeda]|uniref:G_PROTEIN_RECEP_F1_2 domain-containing protein n=1 Tax=Thelazia callipaeda TaxID=103827 RepID=A0A0N5DAJ7_THECL|nr:unnamed protein product [Thelazia callipaeda]